MEVSQTNMEIRVQKEGETKKTRSGSDAVGYGIMLRCRRGVSRKMVKVRLDCESGLLF